MCHLCQLKVHLLGMTSRLYEMDVIFLVYTFPLFVMVQKIPHSLMKVIFAVVQFNSNPLSFLQVTNNNIAIFQSE